MTRRKKAKKYTKKPVAKKVEKVEDLPGNTDAEPEESKAKEPPVVEDAKPEDKETAGADVEPVTKEASAPESENTETEGDTGDALTEGDAETEVEAVTEAGDKLEVSEEDEEPKNTEFPWLDEYCELAMPSKMQDDDSILKFGKILLRGINSVLTFKDPDKFGRMLDYMIDNECFRERYITRGILFHTPKVFPDHFYKLVWLLAKATENGGARRKITKHVSLEGVLAGMPVDAFETISTYFQSVAE